VALEVAGGAEMGGHQLRDRGAAQVAVVLGCDQVELTSGRADLDMSIFLAARQADRLGRRLIEAAAILRDSAR
jgi:hypothetical protein